MWEIAIAPTRQKKLCARVFVGCGYQMVESLLLIEILLDHLSQRVAEGNFGQN
jgi:hypothetical protein